MDIKKIKILEYLKNNPLVAICGLAFILSIIFKITFLSNPFFGLEYEDAFIYSDVSRYLLYNYDWSIDTFQTKSCTDGSLADCYEFSTFSGHYMILPLLVSILHKMIGYSINNIFILNFLSSLITLLFFLKTLRLLEVKKSNIYFATSIYVTIPLLNLFNTSGLAETLSSCFVMIAFYFFLKSYKRDFEIKYASFWLFILVFCISVLIKKENLILIFLPIACCILILIERKLTKRKTWNLFFLFIIPFSLMIFYNHLANLKEMEIREGADIGATTFSLANFKVIFPEFIYSFFDISNFGIAGVLFLLVTFQVFIFRKQLEFKLILTIVWLYIIMYSSHYRSYYQVHFGHISTFETFRYTSNYFPIGCLCLASITFSLSTFYNKRYSRMFLGSLIVLFFSAMFVLNLNTRINMSQMEFEQRIKPVKETLKHTTSKDFIISDVTSIFHIFAEDDRIFINSYSITSRRMEQLLNNRTGAKIYFLRRVSEENNIDRYPDYFTNVLKLKLTKMRDIPPFYELFKLNN